MENMELFEVFPWNENFSTGIEEVDDQHKKLTCLLNSLAMHLISCDPIALESVFGELAAYASYHFQSEERIWRDCLKEDPWFQSHLAAHQSFIPKVLELKEEEATKPLRVVIEDIVKFLIHWLAYHILEDDRRMAIVVRHSALGISLKDAKALATKEMSGSIRLLIDTVLTMYDCMSSRTLDLMRERRERIMAEAALKAAHDGLEHIVAERTAELRQEIAERKKTEHELNKLYQTIEQCPISIVINSLDGDIEYVNPHFCSTTGYSKAEATTNVSGIVKMAVHSPERFQDMWKNLAEGNVWRGEHHSVRKNGERYWENVTIAPIKDQQGNTIKYLGLREDISQKKEYEDRLFREANFSALTGLPNRLNVLTRIDNAIGRDMSFAIVFIELLDINKINDSLGFDAGDHVICTVAKRLEDLQDNRHLLAHMGGGQFLFLLSDQTNSVTEFLIPKIQSQFSASIFIDAHEIVPSCSIGIALYPSDGSTSQDLLRNAHAATNKSKKSGQNVYTFFSNKFHDTAQQLLLLESELRRAVIRNDFILYFQPKVDAASGRFLGAEALIRWQSDKLGFVSPAEFIPIAEQTNLIIPIGNWVIDIACQQASRLRAQGYAEFSIAVNVSPKQFLNGLFIEILEGSLKKYNVPSEYIEIEVTEGLFLEKSKSIQLQMDALKFLGVTLALDDFGTGYSSLAYLRNYPFDTLKIDQAFVRNLQTSGSDADLVRAIIAMGKAFGMKIVAEGVETHEQATFLHKEGCPIFQGYLFGKPMPQKEFEAWVAASMGGSNPSEY